MCLNGCRLIFFWISEELQRSVRAAEEESGRARGDEHPTEHIEAKIHTHRHTNWLPVNTNKSSSSSWKSTTKQLWVPAEPDSPTHWASLRQTHTHALTHWYTYHTQNLTGIHVAHWVFPQILDKNFFTKIHSFQSGRLRNRTKIQIYRLNNFQLAFEIWSNGFLRWGMCKNQDKR